MLAGPHNQETSNGGSRGVSNGSSHLAEGSGPAEPSGSSQLTPLETTNGLSHNGKGASHTPPPTYFGHDREELTRILIQTLSDMGYHAAAESVSKESGFELENPAVTAFRKAVLDGSWDQAEELLDGAAENRQRATNGLVLAPRVDPNIMRVWLRQQKFLELLERRENYAALRILRNEITPLCNPQDPRLNTLASVLMCPTVDDVMAQADWDGAQGQSRRNLLSELSKCISPSVMLPEHRLAVLLDQAKEAQVSSCFFHTSSEPPSLYANHVCDRSQFPTEVLVELSELDTELWQVAFSPDGTQLAACGLSRFIVIYDVSSFALVQKINAHESGEICNLVWSPDGKMLISCGMDRYAKIWDVETGASIKVLPRFEEPVSSAAWSSDCQTVITGSFDKDRSICQWTVQGALLHSWERAKKHRTGDLAVSADGHWLVAMDDRNWVHVYNLATRELEYEWDLKVRPTSISISRDSRHLLVNKGDEAQCVDIATRDVVQKYSGHTGGEYTIRSAFGGANEGFVISGSEDGHVLIWHKASGTIMSRLPAHRPRCNAVSWNPADPCMFATCGDDATIKM